VAGIAGGVLLAALDGGIALLRAPGTEHEGWAVALAGLYVLAFYLPMGLASGILATALTWGVRGWAPPGLPIMTVAPAPAVSSWLLAAITVASAVASAAGLAGRWAHAHVVTPPMAALVVAAVTLASVALALALAPLLARTVRPLVMACGRFASPGAIMTLGASLGALLLWRERQAAMAALDREPLLLVCLLPLCHLGAFLVLRRSPVGTRSAAAAAAVALAGFVVAGATYGGSNRVQNAVEARSVAGGRLARWYAAMTDLDGDGYGRGFGGGDCDDGNPEIHPGAVDVPGDGVDSDCDGTDGLSVVDLRSDGAYGAPVPGLTRPNFVLFVVDALRPDHLGVHGYARPTSPRIDAVAAQGVVFDHAIAQSSRTLYSLPPMFTGMYPSEIPYGDETYYRAVGPDAHTFAEALRDEGYRTAAVMGTDYFKQLPSLFQGFETVVHASRYKADRGFAVREAIGHLERFAAEATPFVLWVHQYNVHAPYLHGRHPSRYGSTRVDKYDTEVALADEQLGMLDDAIARLGLADRTVLVVASDHGEAFGEHGKLEHSHTLYEEEIRSVLLWRVPGVTPRRVDVPVGLLDVAPTVLNLAGVPVRRPVSGRSLLPLMTNDQPDPGWRSRPILSEYMPDGIYRVDKKAIRQGSFKLLWWPRDDRWQLFDLANDPGERRDLSEERSEVAGGLLKTLRTWVAHASRPELSRQAIVERNLLEEVPSMTERLDVGYGGRFTLLGYHLPHAQHAPGETLELSLFFRAERAMKESYFFQMSLVGEDGRQRRALVAKHWPLHARYFTSEWKPGQILRDPVKVAIPPDLRGPAIMRVQLEVLEERDPQRPLPFRRQDPDGVESTGKVLELTQVHIR
jgi:arylsulfatase A-like enzyme